MNTMTAPKTPKFRTRDSAVFTSYCAGGCARGIVKGEKMYVELDRNDKNIGNFCARCGAARFEGRSEPFVVPAAPVAPPALQIVPSPARVIKERISSPSPAPIPTPVPTSYVSAPTAVAGCYCNLLPRGEKCGPCYDRQ